MAEQMKVATKGLLFKSRIEYDSTHIDFYDQHLQFPISLFPFKWIGFKSETMKTFSFDEETIFYKNEDTLFRTTLYISHQIGYAQAPTSQEELASDDKDDWTMMQAAEELEEQKTDYDADLLIGTDTIQIRRYGKAVINDLFETMQKSQCIEAKYGKTGGFLTYDGLAYTEDWAFHIKSKLFKQSEIDSIPIKFTAFFVRTKPLLFGNDGIYCGYHRQINIKSINSKLADEFNEWCVARAPRLQATGDTYRSSVWPKFYSLDCWIHRDQLCLTDEAIVYTRKTLRKDEMTYLPYERVNLFMVGSGWFTRSIYLFGEQNIIPKYCFKVESTNAIKAMMETKMIKSVNGENYKSSWIKMKNWFGRAPRLITTEDRLIYYPSRLRKEIQKLNEEKVKAIASSLNYDNITSVTWHKPHFRLTGTLEIRGISDNIRADQSDKTIHMIIPQLSTFKYKYLLFFSGSLRTTLLAKGIEDKRITVAYDL